MRRVAGATRSPGLSWGATGSSDGGINAVGKFLIPKGRKLCLKIFKYSNS